MLLSFNGLGKIFVAGGRVVGMLRHSRPVVNAPPSAPRKLAHFYRALPANKGDCSPL